MIRQLWLSSRPLSWVNTAYPFAVAYLLTAGTLDWSFWLGTLFFLVPYNFAMYGINDVFDYESDIRNPRKGGVEGAVLDTRLHAVTLWLSAALCMPFVAYFVWMGSAASSLVLVISMFAVVAYSAKGLRFKEVPVLDSMTSSTHFVSPAIFGLVLAGATWTPALVAIITGYFAWGMASHAFGAVQDIQADREGGLRSIATVLGARVTARFALLGYASAGILLLAASIADPAARLWLALAALLVLPYLWMVWPFRSLSDADCEQANRGWRKFLAINFVVGFAATMLLIGYALTR